MESVVTGRYVSSLQEIDGTQTTLVGGKAAHLGELSRIAGLRVPAGYCVTTAAFQRIMAEAPPLDALLDRLSRLDPGDREAIRALSTEIRRTLAGTAIPADLATAITAPLAGLGEQAAYAVRSSATTEDLPAASAAGQHATYLNVVGPAEVLRHIVLCWASLFTERAVSYRLRHGLDHRRVGMGVVVQHMIFPRAAGILFTADPVTGNRKVTTVEAGFGLGEALVSGLVNADIYQVRGDDVISRTIAAKHLASRAVPTGGTREQAIEPERQGQPALTDAQVVRLARLGRRIEAHFGRPQDIEWCLADDDFHIVQSRPITTLFPIPDSGGHENRVYVSVGHQQMMTDPMKPLGLSLWRLTSPAPMYEAGGRLFVDVTRALASPASRAGVLEALGRSDPLIGDALRSILERGDFIAPLAGEEGSAGKTTAEAPAGGGPAAGATAGGGPANGVTAVGAPAPLETDPAIVLELIARTQASIATLQREIRTKSGPALLDFILADIQELRRLLFDSRSHQVINAALEASWWLNEQLQAWLGEKNAADTLTQSVPHNITSEMGLALLDVADAIRPHPEVVAFLEQVRDDDVAYDFLDALPTLPGGRESRAAIQGWLEKYGMRCVGEIDITRPRWSERPTTLLPLLLGNIEHFEPGAGARRFEQGLRAARAQERELLERLRALPDGERKAAETKSMIDRVRAFIGFREYPKYGMISRYFVYKEALLAEAERLVRARVLREREEIFYLTFQELDDVVRTHQVDRRLLRERQDAFRSHRALTPPRVLTSDGEAVAGAYRRRELPAGALVGLPVSAGTVEGRARVILDLAQADLEPGDILVTAYTDPSWTPLFVAAAGLVTEVGGLMTHGAVIAREYGLPAVVGVEGATRRIRDGERIRVCGTEGYVEIF